MYNISTEISKIKRTKDIKTLVETITKVSTERPEVDDVLKYLLDISSIQFNKDIPTAAIRYFNGQYYLYFNLDFITTYVETSDCLLFVVLHELCHKIYADHFFTLHRYSYVNPKFINIVCDLKINSDLCKTIFKDQPPVIIKKLYFKKDANILQKMFCPPEVLFEEDTELLNKLKTEPNLFNNEIKTVIVNKLLSNYNSALSKDSLIQQLIFDTYSYIWFTPMNKTTVDGIFTMVYRLLQILEPQLLQSINLQIPFIGEVYECENNYDCEKCNNNQCVLKSLPKNIVRKFKGIFAGRNNELYEEKLEKIDKKKSTTFYNAILSALATDFVIPQLKEQMLPEYGFIPGFTRKDVFLLASGFIPIVYNTSLTKKEFDETKVHLYIDVSSSTKSIQKVYYGLVLALGDIIGQPIYIFSNKVVEINLNQLKDGIVSTTHGTDIDCVITHAAKKNFHRILLLTDGYVNVNMESVNIAKKKPIRIYVVFTRTGYSSTKDKVPESKLFDTGLLSVKDRNRTWWVLEDYIDDYL